MKKINNVIILLSTVLIGSAVVLGLIPNIMLDTVVTLGCFTIPSLIIFITMIIQIKNTKEIENKEKIRNYWFKVLFIIYCLLLVVVLFLSNEYRIGNQFRNVGVFSREHFEMCNFIPFATIGSYISRLISNTINTNIVIINLSTNLMLLAPMGFFVPILFNEKIKDTKSFIGIIFVVTVVIEIIQFITFRGSTDIDDIILNTIGALIIYLLMKTKLIKNLLKKVFDLT